jgi:hydrogenase expression/formation protein HypC
MDFKEKDQHRSEGCRACLAIPARIVEISSENPDSAVAGVFGVRREVDVTFLQDDKPSPGDWVLIHVGFAMAKISETDALDRLRTLELLGDTQPAAQEICGYDLEKKDDASFIERDSESKHEIRG